MKDIVIKKQFKATFTLTHIQNQFTIHYPKPEK